MLVWLILCYHVLPSSGSQLDKLIQFAHGNGANPSSGSSTRASSPPAPRAGPAQTSRYTVASAPTFQSRQPQPRQQPSPARAPARAVPVVQNRPIPPIPFSDYAPDSKLRVSQPRAPVQSSRKLQYSSKPTSRTQSSSRLPTGFVQIGGAPVKILRSKPKSVTKPATNLPVTRPSTFISRPPPAYSTLNNHHAPRRPVPVPIAQQKQPVINVISNPFHQPEAKEYRSNSQPLNNVQRPSSNRGQSFIQADDAHRLALEEHNAQIEKVKNLQKQRHHTTLTQTFQQHQQPSQQHPISQPLPQQSYSKPVANNPSLPTSSHFNIPGRVTHSQYTAELKLAQDALRSLG